MIHTSTVHMIIINLLHIRELLQEICDIYCNSHDNYIMLGCSHKTHPFLFVSEFQYHFLLLICICFFCFCFLLFLNDFPYCRKPALKLTRLEISTRKQSESLVSLYQKSKLIVFFFNQLHLLLWQLVNFPCKFHTYWNLNG